MVVRFCTTFRFFFIFADRFCTVSNNIDVIRYFIVIPTPTFALSFQISSNNILTDTKNTIDNRPCVPAVSVLLLWWDGGWRVYTTVTGGGGTDTNHRSLATDCYKAVFDAARRLQRTIIGENRARSFFRAGWLMALFASGRAGADGRTVACARIIQIARARADSAEGVRGVMRVKPLVRRNPAAAAHNHTAHYVRRPLRDATARTTRAHLPEYDDWDSVRESREGERALYFVRVFVFRLKTCSYYLRVIRERRVFRANARLWHFLVTHKIPLVFLFFYPMDFQSR